MSTTIDETNGAPSPAETRADRSDKTNILAIVALVLSFVVTVAGIVCGHIALRQIKRSGERGRGIALAATILGYVFTGLWVAFLVIVVPIIILIGLSAVDAVGY